MVERQMTQQLSRVLQEFAHELGAPLCALEVVLAAKGHLPEAQGALLEEAIARLRQILARAQEGG